MTDDGFVITLPYGADSDWVKNVVAAGSATLTYEGDDYRVEHPKVVRDASLARFFSAQDQRTQRLFGVDEYLRLDRADTDAAVSEPRPAARRDQ